LECGIGTLTDANTMMRQPRQTWDGTTLTKTAAVAQDLPAGVLIDLAPQAATVAAAPTTIDTANSAGRFVLDGHRTVPSSTLGLTALRVYWLPFRLDFGVTVTSLACSVTTAGGAGTQAIMGLYAFSASGGIGARIDATAPVAVDSTGFKAQSLAGGAVFLPAGWYIVAIVASAGVTLTANNNSASQVVGCTPFGMNGAGLVPVDYKYEAAASLALPAAPGAVSVVPVGGAFAPAIALGVQ
jgi:hypothetical protein